MDYQNVKDYFPVIFLVTPLLLISCSNKDHGLTEKNLYDRSEALDMQTDFVIGLQNQPPEHQLGRPVAVRTDRENNIYIADGAAMEIKVFNSEGEYEKSIGRRGRGPAEFLDITSMELTPEGNIFVLDKGNFKYKYLTKEGKSAGVFPVDLSSQPSQYYPTALTYFEEDVLGLYLTSAALSVSPIFKRDIFHVYSRDLQEKRYSFAPFDRLGYDHRSTWIQFRNYTGSFTVTESKDTLIYSPGIYDGTLYIYRKPEGEQWEFSDTIKGVDPGIQPYQIYHEEEEYKKAAADSIPGIQLTYFGPGPNMGRLYSMDAGVYQLSGGNIIQFFALWRQPEGGDSPPHKLDLFAQIFDKQGQLQTHGYVDTIERRQNPNKTLVNWKDEQDRFYLMSAGGDFIPTVRRFILDLPDSLEDHQQGTVE